MLVSAYELATTTGVTMSKRNRMVLIIISLSCAAIAVTADHHDTTKISDLGWMTGSWSGPVGQGLTLEENWIQPVAGSLAALVRITGEDETSMVELIVIEEENDSLVLRIKQWDAGFKPRTPEPQTMKLVLIGKNKVGFEAIDTGGLKTLAYSRPEEGKFNIDIENAEGAKFQINLVAR